MITILSPSYRLYDACCVVDRATPRGEPQGGDLGVQEGGREMAVLEAAVRQEQQDQAGAGGGVLH